MKTAAKIAAAALVIKAFLFIVSAAELPESAHHAAIDNAVSTATK